MHYPEMNAVSILHVRDTMKHIPPALSLVLKHWADFARHRVIRLGEYEVDFSMVQNIIHIVEYEPDQTVPVAVPLKIRFRDTTFEFKFIPFAGEIRE